MTTGYHRIVREFLSVDERVALLHAVIPALREVQWEPGRQGTGYDKHALRDGLPEALPALLQRSLDALAVEAVAWDCYLLRYRPGAYVPPHRDPTDAKPHLRLNAIVQSSAGAVLSLNGAAIELAAGDAIVFRPDVVEHAVSAGEGTRYVWSVGCVYEGP